MFNSENVRLVAPGHIEGTGSSGTVTQLDVVYEVLYANRNHWMTLAQIAALGGLVNESSVASRIRDLRTEGSKIERRRHPNAGGAVRVYEYRYVLAW